MNRKSINRQKPQMTLKSVPIFGRSKVTYLSSPHWTSVSTPCAEGRNIPNSIVIYVDVTRSTYADLMCYKRNASTDILSNSWRGFTKFTLQPPKGHTCSRRRLTKIQTTPDLRIYGLKFGRKWVKLLRMERNNDNDNDTLREVPHLSMRAWPYRQERRGHGPTKKDLS